LVIAKSFFQARDRKSTPNQLTTKAVTTQKLNQGKENRQLKPPTGLSRTQLHSTKWSDGKKKEWKPLSKKMQFKIQREMKKMDTKVLIQTKNDKLH
jgi:hypothetical protein